MTPQNPKLRRVALQGSRLAALVSAIMLLLSGYMAVWGQATASAATNNGGVVMTPTSGVAGDTWDLSFATGVPIACPGDSATGQYRVQSFAVPAGTNLDTLTFTSTGPAVGQPLLSPAGDPLVNGLTDITTGNILQLPGAFTFLNNGPTDFSAGDWTLGVACTQGTGSGMTKSYWTTSITISNVVTTGAAADFSWAVGSPSTTTSSSTTTTADPGTTTTTADPGSTTTTSSTIVVKVGPPLTLSSDTLKAGDSVTITASGWQANSSVDIYLHSDPVLIGTLTADESGALNGSVTIPSGTAPGTHEIVALGLDSTGGPMGSSADVTIQADAATPTGGTPAAASPVTTLGQLPYTGNSPLPMVFWAVALLVFGRIAMLLGKRPKVVGAGPTG